MLRLHPLLQVVDGVKCLVLDEHQFWHNRLKPWLVKNANVLLFGPLYQHLTGECFLPLSPYEGPFQEHPQSHTHAPPAAAPQPPAGPVWSSRWGCVRLGKQLWRVSAEPHTPEGTSLSTAPRAWSWNSSRIICFNTTEQLNALDNPCHHSTFCMLTVHSSDKHCTPSLSHSCLFLSIFLHCWSLWKCLLCI